MEAVNQPPSSQSDWSHTPNSRTDTITHSWSIQDFEAKTRHFKAGESLCSPSFTLGAMHLVVKVFPNGTVDNKNHVSIFLANQGQQPFDISEIVFTFATSSACPLSQSAPLGPKKELEPEEDWGFQRFVSHQKLKENRLLSEDGALHLVTRVKTSSEGEGAEGLVPRLWDMYSQGAFTDFNLVCDGQSLPCHKVVLAARSEFFRGLLTTGLADGGSSEFKVTDTATDTMRLLIEFLYTGKVQESLEKLGGQQVQYLLIASDFYIVPGLKQQCEDWLVKSLDTTNMVGRLILGDTYSAKLKRQCGDWLIQSLDTTNMVDMLILGDTYSAARLRRLAKEMLVLNFKKLDEIPDWKKKLAARTELLLEVVEELAKNAL